MTIKDLEYCLKSLGKKYPSPPFLSEEERKELSILAIDLFGGAHA